MRVISPLTWSADCGVWAGYDHPITIEPGVAQVGPFVNLIVRNEFTGNWPVTSPQKLKALEIPLLIRVTLVTSMNPPLPTIFSV